MSNVTPFLRWTLLPLALAATVAACSAGSTQPATTTPDASPAAEGTETTPATDTDEPAAAAVAGEHMARGEHGGHDMHDKCPMKVSGTSVVAEDVDGAAALVFTTTDDVEEVRKRVAMMAEKHGKMHGGEHGKMKGEHEGKGEGMHGEGKHKKGMHMPPSTITTEETPSGMRMVFTPDDPAQLEAVRTGVHQKADKMAGGKCMHGA